MSHFSPGLIAGGVDQYTKILLHFDGPNGSTSIFDTANPARAWTAVGATITTAASKFGGSSLSAGYVDTPDSVDFTVGSGDWTVDCWVNGAGAGTTRNIFGQIDSGGTFSNQALRGYVDNTADAVRLQVGQGSGVPLQTPAGGALGTGFKHLAFVRSGGSLLVFQAGVLQASVGISGAINDSPNKFAVGRFGENTAGPYPSNIDEFRLSVGIARWTSNFTPPTAPY